MVEFMTGKEAGGHTVNSLYHNSFEEIKNFKQKNNWSDIREVHSLAGEKERITEVKCNKSWQEIILP